MSAVVRASGRRIRAPVRCGRHAFMQRSAQNPPGNGHAAAAGIAQSGGAGGRGRDAGAVLRRIRTGRASRSVP